MPNTDYNIDDNNRFLNIRDTDGNPYLIYIDKGNYNALTLRDALNLKFANYTSANYIQCEYNNIYNKFTFTSNNGALSYFTFYGDSPMMKVLGFEMDEIDSTTQAHASLTSTRQIDLSGNNSFYFTTNLQIDNVLFFNTVSVTNHVSTITKQQTQGNVLAKIQFTAILGAVQFFTQQKEFKQQWNVMLDLMFYEVYEKTGIKNPCKYMLEHRFGEK